MKCVGERGQRDFFKTLSSRWAHAKKQNDRLHFQWARLPSIRLVGEEIDRGERITTHSCATTRDSLRLHTCTHDMYTQKEIRQTRCRTGNKIYSLGCAMTAMSTNYTDQPLYFQTFWRTIAGAVVCRWQIQCVVWLNLGPVVQQVHALFVQEDIPVWCRVASKLL